MMPLSVRCRAPAVLLPGLEASSHRPPGHVAAGGRALRAGCAAAQGRADSGHAAQVGRAIRRSLAAVASVNACKVAEQRVVRLAHPPSLLLPRPRYLTSNAALKEACASQPGLQPLEDTFLADEKQVRVVTGCETVGHRGQYLTPLVHAPAVLPRA